VQLLPLADVAVLTFLSPVFVALLAPCVLGEGAGGWPVAASLPLCFAGLLLVAQPTFLFGSAASALNPAGVAIAVAQASVAG
jgi:drug/metabolite transporter (DMT)-like permease